MKSRFPIGLTLATAIALAILCGLGVWQIQRLHWKQALLARIAERSAAAPVPLSVISGQDAEFTRVAVDCPGLASADFVEQYAIRDGQAGARLLSLCPVPGRPPILVDRGFVADSVSARPPVAASTVPAHVIGVLRPSVAAGKITPQPKGKLFYSRDAVAMAHALGAADGVFPYVLIAETATNPDWKALVPAPLPAEITNRHLEYVLTWFGLAATLACVYAAMLWRKLRS
ncbi:MAG: surF1 family protein [Caulobacter sp.]|nr:surF1 family protein [Caulobacter sp.]